MKTIEVKWNMSILHRLVIPTHAIRNHLYFDVHLSIIDSQAETFSLNVQFQVEFVNQVGDAVSWQRLQM